ncbi:ABC transporter ATP-binding protein [Sulfurimonas sp.]|uniref:ABC transporter ATP-binding protein n=1 Tax=Sulfurimonas sp. TaxID=2022749 RepID=UPI002636EBA5|nr:ABC transporter ATP-binding protein [Sulfurimonas sp.]MCW8895330.1 ABC transporter ATP-binding protein [Sulfurimonas sp.]
MTNKLHSIFTKQDKKNFLILVLFSILISIIEVIGISAIMPFMSVAMDSNSIHSNKYFIYFFNLFQFDDDMHFVIMFGIILILYYFFRSAINIYYNYAMAKFSHECYHFIVCRLFKNYMGMEFKDFVKKNSSNLTKIIVSEANNLTRLISSVLFMISELLITVLIYSMMLFINYKITLLLTFFFLINATLMLKTISVKIKKQGEDRVNVQQLFFEVINKSFGNFKLIKLHTSDNIVLKEFKDASSNYSKINIMAQTLLQVPKLVLEAIAFSLIIIIVLYLVWKYENNISSVLSMLFMFVLALYRLMPSINRIATNYNNILFYLKSLEVIHNDLIYNTELLGEELVSFNKEIGIQNINFEYDKEKTVLKDINININKNDKIAFIGESGSGKSTLVDIIMGLHKPTSGCIHVDDIKLDETNIKDWRSKIGYIPQSVYLFDGTVADNIVFGRDYDEGKIFEVLKKANIYDFILNKGSLYTLVGEGGVMLSGGQKQRIAIARALYGNPDILVLDEATSALDLETESKIMDEIYNISEDKTLIIIAHRLSTIERCEKIYRLENGVIV